MIHLLNYFLCGCPVAFGYFIVPLKTKKMIYSGRDNKMNTKKNIILIILTFILISIINLNSCGGSDIRFKESLNDFSVLIESGNLSDLNLIIYYMNPFTLTRAALSVDDLVYGITANNEPQRTKNDKNGLYEQKIVIDGSRLEEHIDLLDQMINTTITFAKKEYHLNARIYCTFSTEKEGIILDIAMWAIKDNGDNNKTIIVNGYNIKATDIFYDILIKFLPEGPAYTIQKYLNVLKQ